jgi:hypothetical protein
MNIITYESILANSKRDTETRVFIDFDLFRVKAATKRSREENINLLLRAPFKRCVFVTPPNKEGLFVSSSLNELSPGLFRIEGYSFTPPPGVERFTNGKDIMHIVNIDVNCLTYEINSLKYAKEEDYDIILDVMGSFLSSLIEKDTVLGKSKKSKNPIFRNKCKYKNVVFVTKKQYLATAKKNEPTLVDWSHRWEVMGHWRRCSTLGKDRDGNYCVIGLTWVSPHIRGEGDLVIKTRVVKGAKQLCHSI